jgi:hypothetical protein
VEHLFEKILQEQSTSMLEGDPWWQFNALLGGSFETQASEKELCYTLG